jgi:hypothetical protein
MYIYRTQGVRVNNCIDMLPQIHRPTQQRRRWNWDSPTGEWPVEHSDDEQPVVEEHSDEEDDCSVPTPPASVAGNDEDSDDPQ